MKRHILLSLTASAFIGVTAFAQTLVPFAPSTNHGGGFGGSSNSLITSEFHGDGFVDIVNQTGNPEGLSLVKGAAGGTFLPEVGLLVGTGLYSSAPRAVDFEGDGDTDIVVGLYDVNTALGSVSNGQIAVFLNDGNTNFTRQNLLSGLSGLQSNIFVVADMNGDGRADFLRSTATTNLIYMQALPGGGFTADVVVSNSFVSFSAISLANMDGDGDLDLVAVDGGAANSARIYSNDGTGAFTLAHTAPFSAASTVVREVVDINGDGLLDLLCTDADATTKVSYYAGVSGGGFSATRTAILVPGSSVNSLRTADLDKDGMLDLLVSNTVSTPSFSWNIGWMRGTGGGTFGAFLLVNTYSGIVNSFIARDLNADVHLDLIAGGRTSSTVPHNVFVFINKTGQDPMVVTPPAARPYVLGDNIETSIYYGFPITVTGTPRISLQIGSSTVNASYVSGSGTSTLLFRYTVTLADLDLDGVQLASQNIDLNGGAMKDPINGDADLTMVAAPFTNVMVNGAGPLVQNITRLDPTPTNAPTVRFQVQFAEDVTGVDAADFELKQDAGDLDGGAVVSVTGSGSSYQVTATTGTGSGTLGLSVKGTATINDLAGDPLAKGFIGGQVYTFKRGAPVTIDAFFTDLHADYRPIWDNGEITFVMDADAGAVEASAVIIPSNEVLTYAAANSLFLRPTTANYDFLGVPVGSSVYRLPSSQAVGIPFLGMSGESVPTGTFARYLNTDPRVNATNAYMKIQLVGMRSSSGGHMSVYTIASGNPRVWMATSDGISSTDAFYQTPGSHTHRNVAFSAPGTYEVDVFVSGYRDSNGNTTYEPTVDPYIESGIFTMVFGVDFPGGPANVTLATDMTGSAPVAVTDAFTAPSGTVITGNVLTNDTDPQSQALTATLRTNAAQGAVSLASDGSFSYTLTTPDYEGSDSFAYWANDGNGSWSFATVNLTITPGNAMPSFAKGSNQFHPQGSTGAQSVANWATAISDGDATVEQSLTFNTNVTSGAAIFSTAPAISSTGTLSYTLSGTSGTAQVSVTLTDDATAGTAALTTAAQTFTVSVASSTLVPFSLPTLVDTGAGTSASNFAMADFNGDGKLDLITGGTGVEEMGYRQGVGDGNFLREQLINAGLLVRSVGILAGDYDVDGDVDLCAIEYNANTATSVNLVVYRNNGSAVFTRQNLLSSNGAAAGFVVRSMGDLNGDGRPDLVYRKGYDSIAYALQQSDGSMGVEVVLFSSLNSGASLSPLVADMDNDGDLDVVTGDWNASNVGTITVFSNNGAGGFSSSVSFAGGTSASVLKLADMNGDGRMDIVSRQSTAGTRVGYYPQLVGGTFGARVNLMTAITAVNSLEVADLNGDGIPDVVAGVGLGGNVLVWSAGLGAGAFGNPVLLDPAQGSSFGVAVGDLDGDGHADFVSMGNSVSRPSPIVVHINKTGENTMQILPPVAPAYVIGDQIEVGVYFGFPITVTGTPRLSLQIGASSVFANYAAGTGTGTLRFRYTVTTTDLDLDGIQLASNLIDLNGGTLTNQIGGAAVLEFPNQIFNTVTVNGAGPWAQTITRLDPTPTNAPFVRFQVQFSEVVTGVDVADFELKQDAGDLDGGAVTGVTGSGAVYQVTAATGSGSGTLGLSVKSTASINDLAGDPLAKGFIGGQVYTLKRGAPITIDTIYTQNHADYRPIWNNGEITYALDADAGVIGPEVVQMPSNEVLTYAGPNAIVPRPAGTNYDFVGVASGANMYLLPSSPLAGVPYLGFNGLSVPNGIFARYLPADSRISSTNAYMKIQLVAMRSSSGGHASVYSIFSGNPRVWMATSNGIDSTDAFYQTPGGHSHLNVAFSQPGTYELDVFVSGYRETNGNTTYDSVTDPYIESGIFTMVFGVDFPGGAAPINLAADMTGLAPVTVDDAYGAASGAVITGNVLNNDSDPQNHTLTAVLRTSAAQGSVSLASDGSFTYTPNVPGSLGNDSFTYWAQDGNGGWTPGTVRLSFSAIAGWRVTHFGTGGNAGIAGDLADADQDGIPNLLEYAFDMNPSGSSTHQLPQGGMNGTFFEMSFTQPLGVTGISYGAEYSTTMAPTDWHPVPNSATPPLHLYRVPATGEQKVFMRIQVTTP